MPANAEVSAANAQNLGGANKTKLKYNLIVVNDFRVFCSGKKSRWRFA
jgi:hypothetical protein